MRVGVLPAALAFGVVTWCNAPAAWADRYVIFGSVTDEKQDAIANGSVAVFDNDRPLLNQPTVRISNGRFELILTFDADKDLDHVLLEVSAPGFERITKTIKLDRPDVPVLPIRLHSITMVDIESIVASESADGETTYVDFMLHNRYSAQADVVRLRLIGKAGGKKSCFDGGAVIEIALDKLVTAPTPATAAGSVKISEPSKDSSRSRTVKSSGEFQYRKCALSALRFEVPYLLPLAAAERVKVHLEVPKKFVVKEPTSEVVWTPVSLGITVKDSSKNARESFVERAF